MLIDHFGEPNMLPLFAELTIGYVAFLVVAAVILVGAGHIVGRNVGKRQATQSQAAVIGAVIGGLAGAFLGVLVLLGAAAVGVDDHSLATANGAEFGGPAGLIAGFWGGALGYRSLTQHY
jgi:hypothetical protein